MSKLREFWIKKGLLDPKEGVISLTAPTDWSSEYFEHIKVLTPEYDAIVAEMVEYVRQDSINTIKESGSHAEHIERIINEESCKPARELIAKYNAFMKGREGVSIPNHCECTECKDLRLLVASLEAKLAIAVEALTYISDLNDTDDYYMKPAVDALRKIEKL